VDTAAKNCPEGTFLAASCTGLSSQSSKSLSDPIIDASPYDVALDSALLHCLSDDDAVTYVTGLAKLLRQGGTFYVGCFSDQNPDPWKNPRRLSKDYLERLLGGNGFDVISIESCWWARPDERGSNMGSYCLAWWCTAVRK